MNRQHKRITPGDIAPTAGDQLHYARWVLRRLIEARNGARLAGLAYTLPRIELAISSARGAVRNAENRANRERGDR